MTLSGGYTTPLWAASKPWGSCSEAPTVPPLFMEVSDPSFGLPNLQAAESILADERGLGETLLGTQGLDCEPEET